MDVTCLLMPISWFPDVEHLTSHITKLHRNVTSPDGKFGFGVTTHHGKAPIEHGSEDTWERYFTRTTRDLLEMEQQVRGEDNSIRELAVKWFERMLPRLLRPMETDGRKIRPVMLHGDLWHGNTGVD
ncbi:hypothetical protein QBC40DRAFT_314510 [Triangularia verruculosa]|uniref:protein-ribulosamine 3-kinase n=1 Tax=Triangularia verruculosa TaxID=2587418 RepID=A0AAN7AY52_9PEZI|nr:hypothetical protein QBC40DRAFT_314510 [Triangularia verruculosa]